jgi:DMSO/TMAO reductase YedYZ molybdopterin-dependent catalytic subunit
MSSFIDPFRNGDGPIDRRRFLALGGLSLSAAYLAACNSSGPKSADRALTFAERKNEGVERALFRHTSMDHAPAGARAAGSKFPSYFVSDSLPVLDPAARAAWRLEVSGLVKTPLRLSLDDLAHMPSITQRVNHYCVEGWTAVAKWTGVRVSHLARLAGMQPDAHYVDFQSFDDHYHESWDLESAMHPQTLIAYGMDDAWLGPAHGAPARVHSPLKLGYKNTKYLTKVVFLAQRNGGYWSDQGYEWYGGT